jgi:hypothetical protein
VLDHLSRPDDVEARIRQRPLPLRIDHAQIIEQREATASPAQRLFCDVYADHAAP